MSNMIYDNAVAPQMLRLFADETDNNSCLKD